MKKFGVLIITLVSLGSLAACGWWSPFPADASDYTITWETIVGDKVSVEFTYNTPPELPDCPLPKDPDNPTPGESQASLACFLARIQYIHDFERLVADSAFTTKGRGTVEFPNTTCEIVDDETHKAKCTIGMGACQAHELTNGFQDSYFIYLLGCSAGDNDLCRRSPRLDLKDAQPIDPENVVCGIEEAPSDDDTGGAESPEEDDDDSEGDSDDDPSPPDDDAASSDRDGDGFTDDIDACPDTAGTVDGCYTGVGEGDQNTDPSGAAQVNSGGSCSLNPSGGVAGSNLLPLLLAMIGLSRRRNRS